MSPAPVIAPPKDLDVIDASRVVDQKTMERAWRATSRFRVMIPQLRAFVRAITRNPDVDVEITAGTPCTDGRTVWLRPPIELGDDVDHDRGVCGERDPDTLSHLCPAHRLHETILTTLFHECAHIVFDSFESLRDIDRAELVRRAVMERPAIDTTRLGKLQARLDRLRKNASYVEVNMLLSPYLPMIFNALEDARVNRSMYEARSGTRVWFQATAIRVFEQGIEREDGTIHRWNEVGRNAQAIIGLYCRASGFQIKGWFVPEVEAALMDPTLGQYLARVSTARSAASVYRLGFPMLERLREMGFCKRPDEPEDDPAPKPMGGLTVEGESDDSGEGASGSSGDPMPSSGVPEDSDDDADTSGGGATPPEDRPESVPDVDDADVDGADEEAETDDEGDDVVTDDDDPIDDEGDDVGEGADDGGSDEDEADDDADGESDDDDEGDDDEAGEDGTDDGADGDGGASDPEEEPSDAAGALAVFGGHAPVTITRSDRTEIEAINRAIVQGEDFDAPSDGVLRVNVHRYDERSRRAESLGWDTGRMRMAKMAPTTWDTPEPLLAKALFNMRTTFAFNRASRTQAGLKHGRVDSKTVHRAPMGDRNVFAKTRIPGRRSYLVVIGLDISGSTGAALGGTRTRTIDAIKQAAMAKAELCHRVGVKFALYAHTGERSSGGRGLYDVDIFEIKSPEEPWGERQRNRLRCLTYGSANLDGHSLEFYRKVAERDTATDKCILYFTDGAMPCENHEDELRVLQREIKTCQRLGIHLVGVGIGTDAPIRHGLDTVRMDTIEDLPKLIAKLERELTRPRVG